MRALPHIKKLEDCFGDFLVHVKCQCGHVRTIRPTALAPIVGWICTLDALPPRMRCSACGAQGQCSTMAIAEPRPRGMAKNPR